MFAVELRVGIGKRFGAPSTTRAILLGASNYRSHSNFQNKRRFQVIFLPKGKLWLENSERKVLFYKFGVVSEYFSRRSITILDA
jgi:hypothetical protein